MGKHTSRRDTKRAVKWSMAVFLGLSLAVLVPAGGPMDTEANWVDAEYSFGRFSTLTVAPPTQFNPCGFQGTSPDGARLRIAWILPSGRELSEITLSISSAGPESAMVALPHEYLRENTSDGDNSQRGTVISRNSLADRDIWLDGAKKITLVARHGEWQSAPLAYEAWFSLDGYCRTYNSSDNP